MVRAQQGDTEALGELFMRHAVRVRRLLVSILGPTNLLDDLTQEVFIGMHKSMHQFEGRSRFSSWLHRIAVNTAMTHLRRPRRHLALTGELDSELPDADHIDAYHQLLGKELVVRMYAILDNMKKKRRVAFTLFAIDGCSIAEVAEILCVSQAVAKSRIWFARRELKTRAQRDPCLCALLEEMTP